MVRVYPSKILGGNLRGGKGTGTPLKPSGGMP